VTEQLAASANPQQLHALQGARRAPVERQGVLATGSSSQLARHGVRELGTHGPGTAAWDLDGIEAAVRQTAPRAAYLIPDFQNPSGALMDAADRGRVAALLQRSRTLAVIDETLVELGLDAVRAHRGDQLRTQRDALVALLRQHLPAWRFGVPSGGQVLWCSLPGPWAAAVCDAAAERGLRLTPGSRFAADGTLESSLRLPYTRPLDELALVVPLLAEAWGQVLAAAGGPTSGIAQADPYVV
jgi:DNA-binding transcriptional MocR family regulator